MADVVWSPAPSGSGVFAVILNLTGTAIASPGPTAGEWLRLSGGTVVDGIACAYVEGGGTMTSVAVTFHLLVADDATNEYDLCNIIAGANEPLPFTVTLQTTATFKYIPLAVGSPTTGIAPWLSGVTAIKALAAPGGGAGGGSDNVKVTLLGRRSAA